MPGSEVRGGGVAVVVRAHPAVWTGAAVLAAAVAWRQFGPGPSSTSSRVLFVVVAVWFGWMLARARLIVRPDTVEVVRVTGRRAVPRQVIVDVRSTGTRARFVELVVRDGSITGSDRDASLDFVPLSPVFSCAYVARSIGLPDGPHRWREQPAGRWFRRRPRWVRALMVAVPVLLAGRFLVAAFA